MAKLIRKNQHPAKGSFERANNRYYRNTTTRDGKHQGTKSYINIDGEFKEVVPHPTKPGVGLLPDGTEIENSYYLNDAVVKPETNYERPDVLLVNTQLPTGEIHNTDTDNNKKVNGSSYDNAVMNTAAALPFVVPTLAVAGEALGPTVGALMTNPYMSALATSVAGANLISRAQNGTLGQYHNEDGSINWQNVANDALDISVVGPAAIKGITKLPPPPGNSNIQEI